MLEQALTRAEIPWHYGHIQTKVTPYKELFESLKLKKPKPATFISLNYDTVLEQALTREEIPWHYRHVPRAAARRVCAS